MQVVNGVKMSFWREYRNVVWRMFVSIKTETFFIAPASSAPAFISALAPKKEIAADKMVWFWC